jgi:hypothetical protein
MINAQYQNEKHAILAVMGEEEGKAIRLSIRKPSPVPAPVSNGNDFNETIMQTLNIKAHNTEIGAMLNKYFPHGLQYIEKRAKHMPASIPACPSKEYSPPILTPIPEGWKPRLTTAKARQGMVKKNKAGNLRGIGQNRLALLRLRMK